MYMEDQQASIERVRKFIEKVLEKADLADCVVDVSRPEAGTEGMTVFNITSANSANVLIGQNGENLRAWQYIIRLLARKHLEEDVQMPFLIDINGYRQQKDRLVFDLVDRAAEEAKKERKPVFLRPMSAYERRLAHLRLAGNEEVATESVGEGDDRKVVIRPKSVA